jgi:hypothetical protein
MQQATRIIVKNLVVALTLGVAAVATWAVTNSNAPTIEAASVQARNG